MNNANNTASAVIAADDFIAGAEIADGIRYAWERALLAKLATDGYIAATYPSGFVTLGGRALADWQVARFVSNGIMKYTVAYDDSIPQSMFDAPVTASGYQLTDLGRVVARLVVTY